MGAGRIGALVSVLVLVGGCADDDSAVARSVVPGNGTVVEVRALDNLFQGERTVISPGTEVWFHNGGRNDHDITPTAGSGWGVAREAFTPGDDYRQVFVTPGEYPYYCELHGTSREGMIGIVVVEDS